MRQEPSKQYIEKCNDYMSNHWLKIGGNLHMERHQNRIKFVGKFCEGTTVEIGAADCFSTNLLKETYDLDITAVEPTDEGFATAEKKYPNLPKVKAFAEKLPFKSDSFDTVLGAEILEHVEDVRPVMNEFFRVAKKRIIVTSPVSEAGLMNDPNHVRYFTYQQLYDLIKYYAKFKNVEVYGLNRQGEEVTPALKNNIINTKVFFGIFVINLN